MMAKDRIRKALLYESLGDRIQCLICERRYLIPEGELGSYPLDWQQLHLIRWSSGLRYDTPGPPVARSLFFLYY